MPVAPFLQSVCFHLCLFVLFFVGVFFVFFFIILKQLNITLFRRISLKSVFELEGCVTEIKDSIQFLWLFKKNSDKICDYA